MENCKTCAYALFNAQWGEYKCLKMLIKVNPDKRVNCEFYKKEKKA